MAHDLPLTEVRRLLCKLGDTIRNALAESRADFRLESLARVAAETKADTIYVIDKISESIIMDWFSEYWPKQYPVEVVMEGVDGDVPLTFPKKMSVVQTRYKCIIDPIDGTRGMMYDKRSAWALAGLAPQKGSQTRLSDIVVASMTELPTSKQWRADQFSAIRGGGVISESIDLRSGDKQGLLCCPSRAEDFRHGFASFVKFFPEGRVLTAKVEEALWDELYTLGSARSPVVFDDQYISTGGQFYELLMGHDRLIADLRPLLLPKAGFSDSLTCHPYDVAAWLILKEAGVIYEMPNGAFPEAPLNTTSPICWVGYANATLARKVRPAMVRALASVGITL